MKAFEKVISIATAEVGYLEKKSNNQLDHKTANAGDKNYTKYARDLYPSLQAQPWCDMFVDWCFARAFGQVEAKQLLGGGFSAYTPTSAQYYKNKRQYHTSNPQPGDQIFFKNSVRINHTGLVYKVDGSTVYTIEGNTSSGTTVVANGGGVFKKNYPLNHSKIDGYGRPDWSLVDKKYTIGWHKDNIGWWYANTGNTYLKNCWQKINGCKYYFDNNGYAVKGWQQISGLWYYFEPTQGHEKECALYLTDANGVQQVGRY